MLEQGAPLLSHLCRRAALCYAVPVAGAAAGSGADALVSGLLPAEEQSSLDTPCVTSLQSASSCQPSCQAVMQPQWYTPVSAACCAPRWDYNIPGMVDAAKSLADLQAKGLIKQVCY